MKKWERKKKKTRLISIDSQPKKVVVVFVVAIIIGDTNLTLNFDQNWVNNR